MKVAFDIGGVISRYPEQMKALMRALHTGCAEVYVLTDMNPEDALETCRENGLLPFVGVRSGVGKDGWHVRDYVLSADWSKHGDRCKSVVMEGHGIDILIDDRPDYCASGDFIGLVLSPRPDVPYYAHGWVNKSTPAVCVPPEEYEAFKRWKDGASPAVQPDALPDPYVWWCVACGWTGHYSAALPDGIGPPFCPQCFAVNAKSKLVRKPLSEMEPKR